MICVPADQLVLLTLHARLGRWLQTGGHLEAGDASLEAAARREAAEESGIEELQLDREPLLLSEHAVRCRGVGPSVHLDVQYLLISDTASAPTVGEESHDVQWFPASQLPDVDASVRALVAAAAKRLRW